MSDLSKPIQVEVHREGPAYYAENETLGIYASGNSEQEAIEDFCQHVFYFHKHYKDLDCNKVISRARELKETYGNLFQEQP